MFYRYSLTIPANTPATAPVTKTMYLAKGIIHQIEIGFPPGCAGLVHVVLYHYEHQVWPSNPDDSFAWDGYNIVIDNENFDLIQRPYSLSLRAWSEDSSYPHTIACRIGVKSPGTHQRGTWIKNLLKNRRRKAP